MAGQYFPGPDGDFRTWMQAFLTNLLTVMTALGLPATFDDALIALFAAFDVSLTEQEQADVVKQQKTAAKKTARTNLVAELRRVVIELNAKTTFTDALRALLGLPPRDVAATPIEPGLEIPSFEVEIIGPQKHRIHFWHPGVASGRRGKPEWARACRIMYAIVAAGAPAPPIGQMLYLVSDTATPYDWDIPAEHVGKTVYYRVAWETPTGDLGPWSAPIGATVTA